MERAGEGEARKAAEEEREAVNKGPEERTEEAGAGEEEEAAACVVEGEASAALKNLLISDNRRFTLFLKEGEKENISFLSCVCVHNWWVEVCNWWVTVRTWVRLCVRANGRSKAWY